MDGDSKMAAALRDEVESRIGKLQRRLKQAHAGKEKGVHKARTELRRVRVELDTMAHTAFDARATESVSERLHDVERALAKTRDADVLLDDLRAYAKGAGAKDAHALADVMDRLERRRDKSAKRARKALDRRTRAALSRALRDVVKSKHVVLRPPKNPARAAPELVRHFTHQEAWRRYDALRAYDARLPADVATLHKLRSACRELRFTLEAFAPALPALASVAVALHHLQTEMGELHDHQVAIDLLAGWRRKGKIRESQALDRYLAWRADARDELRSRSEPRWLGVLGESFRSTLSRALEPHAEVAEPKLAAA